MRALLIAVTFISFISSSLAKDYHCSVSKEVVAKEIVTLELLGMRLSDRFKCLNNDAFKHIKARHEAPEEGYRRFEVGVDLKSLKITKLEPIDESTGQYFAHFEVRSTKAFGAKVYQDKVHLVFHPSKKIQSLEGCGDSLFGPSKFFLADQCYQ